MVGSIGIFDRQMVEGGLTGIGVLRTRDDLSDSKVAV